MSKSKVILLFMVILGVAYVLKIMNSHRSEIDHAMDDTDNAPPKAAKQAPPAPASTPTPAATN